MESSSIDWKQAIAEFWEKMARNAPRTKRSVDLISTLYERIWKEVKPFAGVEEKIEISVDKQNKLRISLAGWVLLGAITIAAAEIALEEFDKSEQFQKLREKEEDLEKEVAELKAKFERLKEYKEIA